MVRPSVHAQKIIEILKGSPQGLTFAEIKREYERRGWRVTDALISRNIVRLFEAGVISKQVVDEGRVGGKTLYKLSDAYFNTMLKKTSAEMVFKTPQLYIGTDAEKLYNIQDELENQAALVFEKTGDVGAYEYSQLMGELYLSLKTQFEELFKNLYAFEALRLLSLRLNLRERQLLKKALLEKLEEGDITEIVQLYFASLGVSLEEEDIRVAAVNELILKLIAGEKPPYDAHPDKKDLILKQFFETLAQVDCVYILPVNMKLYEKMLHISILEEFERWLKGQRELDRWELERMQSLLTSWVDYVKKHGFPEEVPTEGEILQMLEREDSWEKEAEKKFYLYHLCNSYLIPSLPLLTIALLLKHHPRGRELEFYEELLTHVQRRLIK